MRQTFLLSLRCPISTARADMRPLPRRSAAFFSIDAVEVLVARPIAIYLEAVFTGNDNDPNTPSYPYFKVFCGRHRIG